MRSPYITKAFVCIILMSMIVLLGGCWDKIEIDELSIVTATAIDKHDDGQVEISLEIFIPKSMSGSNQGGGGAESGGGQTTMVISHKGKNMADALSKLEAELPRRIFWGSCKVFIFGTAAAKDGIQHYLDFLLRHPQPRERAFVFVSEGKAKKIIEQKAVIERYSAQTIHKKADAGHGLTITLQDLEKMITDEDQGAALPYLKLKNEQTSAGKVSKLPNIHGMAVFKKEHLTGIISESTTRGLLWLRGEIEEYTVNVKPKHEQGVVSIVPVLTRVNLSPKIQGGEWKMIVNIKTEGTVVQNSTSLDMAHKSSEKKIQQAYRKMIKQRVTAAINESQKLEADIVHFGKEFHRKYPEQWKKVENRWQEMFPNVKTELVIEAHIRRPGYIHKPIKTEER
ncbi:spore germination protein KC [Bacillus thermophilus]|uniref:Spore germination protein KC n=1 Tax=Siminovitchia thermophila TaxID=1245522 RepID=A0ABS2R7A0_9BACI|nr:Ger(x)C family spore germination protein [Siminovitchia thermophila]MBM7715537.1 spore germination protein KC [Siminovitchia thermophila]ONK20959.1 hypothetical protein BLX87_24435 [Bacillus sp. VT-16-64]